ncbi:MAG: OstA-like protein [Flavobacteriaceae bacterium]|nr:OstA-like protein [Flavobacteriaceae bacterium]
MKYFLFVIAFCCFSWFYSQEPQPIDYKSDRTRIDEENFPGATIFTKVNNQVYFNHDGIEVWCDQALFYQSDEFFKAYGNVKMVQGDTVTLISKYAEYNGITQFAFASEDVVLTSPSNTLITDTLFFNREKQESYYRSGGIVKDSTNTIESIVGRYYMEREKYAFRKNVVVTNPEYRIDTEILDFYTETGHAYLYGPSTITGEDSKIYCEKGFYDTQLDEGHFQQNANVDYDTRNLKGDSIYFRQRDNFASATNNIVVTDTANNSVVKGHYAEMYKDVDSLFITKNPIASSLQDKDSVHIASDILMLTGKSDQRILRAFNDARIFKTDLSGKADSIWSSESIGLTKLITNPILWAEESQITGDTIHLISNLETNKLDTLKVFNNAFMVMKDSIEGFNQVKGKEMYALFNEDNDIYEVNFIKNTETIYYVREDDGDLVGIDKALSSAIKLNLENNEITDIWYYVNVDSNLYPEDEFPPNFRRLKGFLWRGDETIRSKEDLFTGRESFELVKIQGIKDPDLSEEEEEGFFETKDGESVINPRSSFEEEINSKDGERELKPKIKPQLNLQPQTEIKKNKKDIQLNRADKLKN